MKKIFIISPTNIATGGTELLQQLCYTINQKKTCAYMYYTENYDGSAVEKKFNFYHNPIAESIIDDISNIVIIPETRVDFYHKVKKAKVYFWWLSVDNYYGAFKINCDVVHKIYYKIKDFLNSRYFREGYHLVQSEYAKMFLVNEKKIDNKKIQYLSDYINESYMNAYNLWNKKTNRDNIIVYNPKKGIEFTKKIMAEVHDYHWVAIENMNLDEVINLLLKSKVYIDFGNHPGKDRIPREAALCGCCIITGKRGAAKNSKDIPIDSKFDDDDTELKNIHLKIDEFMCNYEKENQKFEKYRLGILKEKKVFTNQIDLIFKEYIN